MTSASSRRPPAQWGLPAGRLLRWAMEAQNKEHDWGCPNWAEIFTYSMTVVISKKIFNDFFICLYVQIGSFWTHFPRSQVMSDFPRLSRRLSFEELVIPKKIERPFNWVSHQTPYTIWAKVGLGLGSKIDHQNHPVCAQVIIIFPWLEDLDFTNRWTPPYKTIMKPLSKARMNTNIKTTLFATSPTHLYSQQAQQTQLAARRLTSV